MEIKNGFTMEKVNKEIQSIFDKKLKEINNRYQKPLDEYIRLEKEVKDGLESIDKFIKELSSG